MRKKIPTITRPDPAYAASLRQDIGEARERGDAGRVPPTGIPVKVALVETLDHRVEVEAVETSFRPERDEEIAKPPADAAPVEQTFLPKRKLDIRVNALSRQEAPLRACGVDPAHVVRAALRRAVKGWQLAPGHVPPSKERRTKNTVWQARTSLAVDAGSLQALLHDHDPLDVLSKWALVRGQVEPRVWAEIDAILVEIEDRAASRQQPADTRIAYPRG